MSAPQIYSKSKSDLSRLLGITRATLDAWIREEGSPKLAENGRYRIADWMTFREGRKVAKEEAQSDTPELKRKKLQQEIELNDIKILKESGDLVPVEWAKNLVAHLAISVCQIVKESDIPQEAKDDLTLKVEAINFENYLSQLRAQIAADVAGQPSADQAGVEEGSTAGKDQAGGVGQAQAQLSV